jgi:hypothetical protein
MTGSSVAIQSDIDHLKLNYGAGNHYLQLLLLLLLLLLFISLIHSHSFRSITVHTELKILLLCHILLGHSSQYTSNYTERT